MKLLIELRTNDGETLVERYVKIDPDNLRSVDKIIEEMIDSVKEDE